MAARSTNPRHQGKPIAAVSGGWLTTMKVGRDDKAIRASKRVARDQRRAKRGLPPLERKKKPTVAKKPKSKSKKKAVRKASHSKELFRQLMGHDAPATAYNDFLKESRRVITTTKKQSNIFNDILETLPEWHPWNQHQSQNVVKKESKQSQATIRLKGSPQDKRWKALCVLSGFLRDTESLQREP